MNSRARSVVYAANSVVLAVLMVGQMVADVPPAWTSLLGISAGTLFAASAVTARQRREGVLEAAEPVPENGSPWPDGQYYDWCQGCNHTPNRRLMAWTDSGLYRCRNCRADGEAPEAVVDLIESVAEEGWPTASTPTPPRSVPWPSEPSLEGIFAEFDAFHTERPVECDGRRGNHGDPAIVCAMCAEDPEDEQDARDMLNAYGL